jgi:hypothetical protein
MFSRERVVKLAAKLFARRRNGSNTQSKSEVKIMKKLVSTIAVISALAAPCLSFAQTNAPLTRAQVRAELVQLEAAGYNPNGSDPAFPERLQAAEARVKAQTVAQDSVQSSDYGAVANGSSQAGRVDAAQPRAKESIFGE